MKRTVRTLCRAAAPLALAMLVAGCTSSASSSGDSGTDVTIGFAAPLTGEDATHGQGMKKAVHLAVAEANASDAAKKAEYTFAVRAEDDMGDPKQAVNVANLLASDPSVVGVVGHFNSGCSIPSSSVYNGAKLVMVSVSSNPALTARGLPNVAHIVAKEDAQGAAAPSSLAASSASRRSQSSTIRPPTAGAWQRSSSRRTRARAAKSSPRSTSTPARSTSARCPTG